MQRLPSLDGIRGIAILMVLGAHLTVTSGFPTSILIGWNHVFNGPLGVRIFFVLSGFLITHLLLREESSSGTIFLKNFYIRRALRILPVYLAFLLVLAAIAATTQVRIPVAGWISSLTFTKNYWGAQWIDGHLWSISVEEQFYVLWPIALCRLRPRGRLASSMVLIVLAPIFRVGFYHLGAVRLGYFSFLVHMDTLMIGCLAAIWMHRRPQQVVRATGFKVSLARAAAVLVIYGARLLELHDILNAVTVPFGPTVQSAAVAYLILSCIHVRSGILYRTLNQRLLVSLGTVSYGLYIWQQPFMAGEGFYGSNAPRWFLECPWALVTACVVAVASYHMIEKPMFALRSRYRDMSNRPAGR